MRIGPDAAQYLEGGSALIVGAADADGAPLATRAWGAMVAEDGAALRVYLDAEDAGVVPLLTEGIPLAITGACVRTLMSTQVKGRVRSVDPLDALDIAHARALRPRCSSGT